MFSFSLLLFCISAWLNNHVGKFSDGLVNANVGPNYLTPIYDVYYSNVNRIFTNYHMLPDICTGILFITAVIIHGEVSFANFYLSYNLYNIEQILYQTSILYLIRATACRSTIGYASKRHTLPANKSLNNMAGLNCYFSDLVISGHTITSTISFCFLFDVYAEQLTQIISVVLMWLVSVSSNLLIGDHYTSDIFIAIVLTFLLHW